MSINMADDAQLKQLMQYISENLHYPVLGFGGGADLTVGDIVAKDVTIGTVISGFLYADGTVYNIADYPQLAAHYASHKGAANFYGGDGVTTFAVPDLRGEFIRGCGTNGHSDEGNGAGVGVHQGATKIPSFAYWQQAGGTDPYMYIGDVPNKTTTPSSNVMIKPTNVDRSFKPSATGKSAKIIVDQTYTAENDQIFTARPTNTSYPFYIKATVGHTYSTDEQPVGTDENGDVIYQRTFTGTVPSASTTGGTTRVVQTSFADKVVKSFSGVVRRSDGTTFNINTCFVNTDTIALPNICSNIANDGIYMKNARSNEEGASFRIVVEYTKTGS